MEKNDFEPDTRYTVAWQPPGGHVVAATLYVHRLHESFMIARISGADGTLRKIAYPEIIRIVSAEAVAPAQRRPVPAALLDEKSWRERTVMAHYASSPALGK